MQGRISALEAGASGDCLFFSIAAGLHILHEEMPGEAGALETQLGVPIVGTARTVSYTHLTLPTKA